MKKNKYELLEKAAKVAEGAQLKDNSDSKMGKTKILISAVPIAWAEAIKSTGLSFSSYARTALYEKLKRDGLI